MGSHPQESSWDDVDDAPCPNYSTSTGAAPIPMMSFHKKVLAASSPRVMTYSYSKWE